MVVKIKSNVYIYIYKPSRVSDAVGFNVGFKKHTQGHSASNIRGLLS